MSDDRLLDNVALAIFGEDYAGQGVTWYGVSEECRQRYRRMASAALARAALAAMPPQPAALPAEPPPVRVRVAVFLNFYALGRHRAVERSMIGEVGAPGWKNANAILIADVKPLTPPEIAATVEGGR